MHVLLYPSPALFNAQLPSGALFFSLSLSLFFGVERFFSKLNQLKKDALFLPYGRWASEYGPQTARTRQVANELQDERRRVLRSNLLRAAGAS